MEQGGREGSGSSRLETRGQKFYFWHFRSGVPILDEYRTSARARARARSYVLKLREQFQLCVLLYARARAEASIIRHLRFLNSFPIFREVPEVRAPCKIARVPRIGRSDARRKSLENKSFDRHGGSRAADGETANARRGTCLFAHIRARAYTRVYARASTCTRRALVVPPRSAGQ